MSEDITISINSHKQLRLECANRMLVSALSLLEGAAKAIDSTQAIDTKYHTMDSGTQIVFDAINKASNTTKTALKEISFLTYPD